MKNIVPCLWFVKDADKAAKFYLSIFGKDSKTISNTKLENTPGGPNTYIIELELNGFHFTFMNAGKNPGFDRFCPSTSFIINCKDQKETDHYWNALSKSGKIYQCGWITDKYGVTWQVVPTEMIRYICGPDKKGRDRAMKAMLKMKKLNIAAMKKAYHGK